MQRDSFHGLGEAEVTLSEYPDFLCYRDIYLALSRHLDLKSLAHLAMTIQDRSCSFVDFLMSKPDILLSALLKMPKEMVSRFLCEYHDESALFRILENMPRMYLGLKDEQAVSFIRMDQINHSRM